MLNKITLIGRLGQDPEMRQTQKGGSICNLRIATNESYIDHDGNKIERTEWHTVVAYQKLADTCNRFLGKGSLVYVEGALTTQKWQDKEGNTRYTTKILARRVLFLSQKNDKKGEEDTSFSFPSESADMDELSF